MKYRNHYVIFILMFLVLMLVYFKNDKYGIIDAIPDNLNDLKLDRRISDFLTELGRDKFEICMSEKCIPQGKKESINCYMGNLKTDFFGIRRASFDRVFTFDPNKCNLSCIVDHTTPVALVKYIVISDNYLGITYEHGGLGTSYWFVVFQINNNKVKSYWEVRGSPSPYDLVPCLLVANVQTQE